MAGSKNIEKADMKVGSKFSKEQLLSSKKYANRRDLVDALLEDGKEYATDDVDKKIESFMKGKVKK